MANPALGAKQICPNCQSKFYDLGRRPAHCPKCETEFDPEEALKSRVRTRSRAAPTEYEEPEEKEAVVRDEEADELEEKDETPEIDQAADEPDVIETDDDVDPNAPVPAAPDLGVDFEEEGDPAAEDDDDVPFLEDDEEDFPDDDIEGLPEEGEEDR